MDARALVTRIHEVCPVPAVAQRVIALANDPASSIREIAETIATDPGLAAEVLRIANSPVYGRRRAVSDLADAVMTLGLSEVGSMASAMAMLAAFASTHERAQSIRGSAVLSGAVARKIAGYAGADPRPAFLGGLLADIGALACLTVDSDAYAAILASENPSAAEVDRYGCSSRAIGAELLRANDLPEEIAEAIGAGDDSMSFVPLARVVLFARRATPILKEGTRSGDREAVRRALQEEARARHLSIDSNELMELVLEAGQRAIEALRRAG